MLHQVIAKTVAWYDCTFSKIKKVENHSSGGLQAAYEDADSAAMALQAVAPVGLKHLQSDKLVLKQKSLLVQTQLISS